MNFWVYKVFGKYTPPAPSPEMVRIAVVPESQLAWTDQVMIALWTPLLDDGRAMPGDPLIMREPWPGTAGLAGVMVHTSSG